MPNDYKRGEPVAFATHALSHLNALKNRALNEKRNLMEAEIKKSNAMAMGNQIMNEEQRQNVQESEETGVNSTPELPPFINQT